MLRHASSSIPWIGSLNRREVLKRASAIGLGGAAASALGGTRLASAETAGEGVRGGTLRYATGGEVPTLDVHLTTALTVTRVMWNVYETLFAWNADFEVIPMLAESHTMSDDQLTHTVTLRQGVPFHNGEELKAQDVIASFERWSALSGLGGNLKDASEEVVAVDDYTVEWRLSRPFSAFLAATALTNQGMAIYPKSVIDATGDDLLSEYIGTGPYRFVEHQADRFVRLERFDDYAALPGEPDGYGGHKYQYFDAMEYIPVPDAAARVAGLQTGDYHYLETLNQEEARSLEGDPNIQIDMLPATTWRGFVLNWRSPLMGDQKIRQAFQAALGSEEILLSSEGEGYFRLDPGLMFQETAWHSTAGEELYNQADPERASQLLQEAGYDGTPIRFMTTQEYLYHYNPSLVARQHLEAAGFAVDLQTYDWATLVDRRTDETAYDCFSYSSVFKSDPVMMDFLQLGSWPGWWTSDRAQGFVDQLQAESDPEVRQQALDDLQQTFYEEVPIVKVGDALAISARPAALKGFTLQTQLGEFFWNAWLEE
jgi:peptide/nickel transport system substrate-binding protein